MEFRIPFNGRPHHYTESEIATVVKVMRGSAPLTQGDCLQSFEKSFEQYARVEHAFALSNATAGLEASEGVNSASVSDGSHESVYLCPFYVTPPTWRFE